MKTKFNLFKHIRSVFASNSQIKHILTVTIGASLTVLVCSMSFLSFRANNDIVKDSINAYEKEVYNEVNSALIYDAENIYNILNKAYVKYKNGHLTENSSQVLALSNIEVLLLSEEINGFWIDTYDGQQVYSPILNDFQVTNRRELKDKNGVKYLDTIINSLENTQSASHKFTLLKEDDETYANCMTYSIKFDPWNWVITTRAFVDDEEQIISKHHKDLNGIRNRKTIRLFILGSLLTVAIVTAAGTIGLHIANNLGLIVSTITRMEQGDLTSRLNIISKDELKVAGDALNIAQDQITQLISNINDVSSSLQHTVTHFTKNYEDMNTSISNVSDSILSITENINNQAQATTEVSSSVNSISGSIEYASTEIDLLEENSATMIDYSNKSMNSLNELLKINNTTQEAINEMYKHTSLTNESVNNINKSAELIQDIASQTNLLSLNASIEAARAGEHGKGFSVVATEIGALATQSATTAKEINSTLEALTTNFARSMEIMQNMSKTSKIQNNTLLETSHVFEELTTVLNTCAMSIDNIASMILEINNKNENIVSNIDKLNTFSTNNAAYTEETSAMTEELTDLVNATSEQLNNLSNEFKELDVSLTKFKY